MASGLAASAKRSRRSARRGRLSEINVTPFVDVMLVLLIVFMVTAPLLTVSIPIELPKTEAKQSAAESDPLSITVLANGDVYLQESKVQSLDDLVPHLRAISREGYDRQIYIRGDEHTPYGAMADVLARISAAGFRKIQLVTDTRDTPGPRAARPPG